MAAVDNDDEKKGDLTKFPSFQAAIGLDDTAAESPSSREPLRKQMRTDETTSMSLVPPGLPLPVTNPSIPYSSEATQNDVASLLQATMQSFITMQSELMKQQQTLLAQQLAPVMKMVETVSRTVDTPVAASSSNDKVRDGTVKALPPEVWSKLEQRKAKYLQDVMKYQKAYKTCGRLQEMQTTFDKAGGSGKITCPTGVRPFNSPPTFAELDTVWSQVEKEDYTLQIKVPKHATRRQAMQQIHWVAARFAKRLEMEAQKEHMTNVHVRAKKQNFLDGCRKIISDSQDQSGADELGLDRPVTMALNTEWRDQQLEKLYTDTVSQLLKIKDKEREKEEKAKEQKEKTEQDLQRANPKELMVDLVKALGMDDGIDNADTEDKIKKKCEDLVDALMTKNALSPGDGLGYNQKKPKQTPANPETAQKKGKSKGDSERQSKGKGKGKGQKARKGSPGTKGGKKGSKTGGKRRDGKGRW